MNITCHQVTGEIFRSGTSEQPPPADHVVIKISFAPGVPHVVDATRQRIDVEYGALIDKTPAEQALALMPTDLEVMAAIYQELKYSDEFMPPDRPMTADLRAAWLAYRASLRGLSKLPTPADTVKAWPLRPAKAGEQPEDAIAHLRARIV